MLGLGSCGQLNVQDVVAGGTSSESRKSKAQGSGLMVEGLGKKSLGFRFGASGFGFWVSGFS